MLGTWPSMTELTSESDRHVLDLQVVANTGEPALAADAAVLHASGRGLDAAHPPAVDPDRPGLDLACQPHRPGDVPGIDPGGKPVAQAIGEVHRLVLAGDVDGDADGAEDFLPRDGGIGIGAIEDGGRDEIAAREMARAVAPQPQPRTVGAAPGDIAGDPLILLARDDGADIGILHPRPDAELRRLLAQQAEEILAD